MGLVLAPGGKMLALKSLVAHELTLHLFSNDQTASENDAVERYTEPIAAGYAPKQLNPAIWRQTGDGRIEHAPETFKFGASAGNVYGYFVTEAATGALVYVERFHNGPFAIKNIGDQITVTPVLTAK